jgi:acyl-CoA synthetase (AMP-forming)/AMP-acid ligase II
MALGTSRADADQPPAGEPIRDRYLRAGFWSADETLQTRVAATAARAPRRPAAVDAGGRTLAYGELDARADSLARGLRALGVQPGDVVGMQLPNRVEALVAMCGIERAGAAVVPLMPMYRAKELTHVAGAASMRTLVVQGSYRGFDYTAQAAELIDAGVVERALVLDREPGPAAGGPGALHDFEATVAAGASGAAAGEALPSLDPDAEAAIMFTSGTTGSPKGVLHTHNTMLAGNRILAGVLGLGEDDTIFVPSVVGHATGYVWGIRFALQLGARAVLMDKWDPERAASLLAEQECRWTMVAPTFVQDLLEAARRRRIDIGCLRYLSCGGAAPPTDIHARAREQLGCDLLRLYGQTEAFLSTHCLPSDPEVKLTSSEGRALPGAELRVVRDDGSPALAGEEGELLARGPHRAVGLLEAGGLRRLGPGEWIPSGDLAAIDADGYLSIRGRIKEFVNRGGFKYSPVEVEDLLHRHPAIARAAVIAMPDARLGEKGCACVIVRDGVELSLDDLTGFLRENGLAPFKWPERLVTLERFPTTPSGKIQKHLLQQLLAEGPEVDDRAANSPTTVEKGT